MGSDKLIAQHNPPSVSKKHLTIVNCSLDMNETRLWFSASRLHLRGTIYRKVKPATPRLSCHGKVRACRILIFILKTQKRSGNTRKGPILSRELVSCLKHYKMPIWIWFKREYWCLIKFTFTNQSEVHDCQPSWLAYRTTRGNWEGTQGWFTRWGALGRMYQDQF